MKATSLTLDADVKFSGVSLSSGVGRVSVVKITLPYLFRLQLQYLLMLMYMYRRVPVAKEARRMISSRILMLEAKRRQGSPRQPVWNQISFGTKSYRKISMVSRRSTY
jgi:hypothetical protein